MELRIESLTPDEGEEIQRIAERMRLTLMEVVGEERGKSMYEMPWLEGRVRQHLDSPDVTGAVFVARVGEAPASVGHTIVRIERDEEGEPMGLFSTSYVAPSARRHGIADALLLRGEAWMRERKMPTFATHTSSTNTPLIRLYEKHGYKIVQSIPEDKMIRLAKPAC